ncbi:MAG TPA: 4Fe-4S binding protein, partial [Candidatus Aminicenantes bacterium]|nr:4Fe-4S binding protein [Candidatus Aminicenantes bacterium]
MKNKIILSVILGSLFFAGSAFTEERFFEIKAKKFSYTPNIIKVNKGDLVRIRLISEDVHHGFFLDGYNIQTSAYPGQEGSLKFVADKTGRFSFRCSVTCGEFHPYMIGLLKVEPNRLYFFGVYFSIILGIGAVILTIRRKNVGSFKLFGLIPLDWRFELTKYKFVRSLFKSRLFPFVPILINLAIFTALLLAMFTGGFSAGNYNVGIMIVWILWWVLLMLFMVPVVGRFWCMVCPFPMIGDWIQRGKLLMVGRQKFWGLNKRWPKKWNNLWPLVILFFITTWFSGFFTVRPLASFILLGGIILSAIIFSLFFRKRSFCLYACPVSGFQGLYANFSICEVRVKDPNICKNHTPKTCAVGSEKGYGCPWMELPYDMNRNTY